jgi:hypothetical protein
VYFVLFVRKKKCRNKKDAPRKVEIRIRIRIRIRKHLSTLI